MMSSRFGSLGFGYDAWEQADILNSPHSAYKQPLSFELLEGYKLYDHLFIWERVSPSVEY